MAEAQQLNDENVKRKNEQMLKNNVSMSRKFCKYKAFVHKNTSKITHNSDSEDSIDAMLNRLNGNDQQKSYCMIKDVQKRLKERRIFDDLAKN